MPVPTAPPRFVQEVRATGLLALPLVLGHVSAGLISFVDNAIAGHHGTVTFGAVSTGTALLWLPMGASIGTLVALTASVSRLHGAGRENEIGPLFRQALWLGAGLGVLMFAFLSIAPLLLPAFGTAANIIPGATGFLHAVRWGVPALALYFCMRYLSEGMHWTLPTMLLGFAGLLTLGPLGYALCNGKWGMPELGAKGLGIASAVTMWAQALCFAWYLRRTPRFAHLRLFGRFEPLRWHAIGGLLRTGLPIGITILMEGGLFIVTTLLIGRLGAVQASAHQIATNVAQLCFMLPLGVAEATTVRVGHAVGRGDAPGMRRAIGAGYAIVLVTQALSSGLLLLGHARLVRLYSDDLAVAALASALLLYAAAFQLPDGVQALSAGALRGLKDTRVPMLIAMLAYWGVGMPLGAALGLGMSRGPQGMWVGLIVGLTTAAALLGWRLWASIHRVSHPPPALT